MHTRKPSTDTPRAEYEHDCRGPSLRAGPFDHHRLDAFAVARAALVRGERLARGLPRGYGSLADQLRRSLLSAYLQTAEAANRSGRDRLARFRGARGEAITALLARLCAMLTRLGRPRR